MTRSFFRVVRFRLGQGKDCVLVFIATNTAGNGPTSRRSINICFLLHKNGCKIVPTSPLIYPVVSRLDMFKPLNPSTIISSGLTLKDVKKCSHWPAANSSSCHVTMVLHSLSDHRCQRMLSEGNMVWIVEMLIRSVQM